MMHHVGAGVYLKVVFVSGPVEFHLSDKSSFEL